MNISVENRAPQGIKRALESEEVERPTKRARLDTTYAVHELVAISEHEFSTKSTSDITAIMKMVQNDALVIPNSRLKLLRSELHVIQDRITSSNSITQDEKETLFKDIKENFCLLKKAKGLANIATLWDKRYIEIIDHTLRFSDSIIDFIDNEFLRRVFTSSEGVNFSDVHYFDFQQYPRLNADTPELIYTYCPEVFSEPRDLSSLQLPRFCNLTLVAQGQEIRVNRWFLGKESKHIEHALEEFGADNLQMVHSPEALYEALNCLHDHKHAEFDRRKLADLLKVATYLDTPSLIEVVDRELAELIRKKLYGQFYSEAGSFVVLGFQPGFSHDDAIKLIQDVKSEFKLLHILPKTGELLNKIAKIIFEQKAGDQSLKMEEKLRDFIRTFNEFGPKNIFANFSLLESFPYEFVEFSPNSRNAYNHEAQNILSPSLLVQYQHLLELCVTYNPVDVKAHEVLALQHQWGTGTKSYKKAKKSFETLLKLNALTPPLRCAYAELLCKMNDRASAIDLLDAAMLSGPTDAVIYVTLAHILHESGNPKKALALLRQFDDPKGNYNDKVRGSCDDIRFYALYLRALDGEKFTEADVQPYFERASTKSLMCLVSVVILGLPMPNDLQINDKLVANLQRDTFDPMFQLMRGIVPHLPEGMKTILLSDQRTKSLLTDES